MPRGLRSADEVVRRRPLPALGSGVLAVLGYAVLIVAIVAMALQIKYAA